jgi:porin
MRFCQVLGFGSAGLLMAALLGVIVPAAAHADCDVPETGVAEEAVPIDFSGIRKSLAENGLAIGGYYAAETFGNPTGGFKQGAAYDGVLELHLNADMRKLGLWKGLCFYTDAFQIHGRSITADYVRSLVTVSNTEATPATKLYELWLQQSLFNKHLSVRVGQLAADGDFFVLEGVGDWFLDGSWGWPTLFDADLPNGGPSYPLATPGIRVLFSPRENYGLKIALYNGAPAGPNCKADPEVCDPAGLEFRLGDPPLLFAEAFYQYNQKQGLAGTIKIGGWNHCETFEDQRLDVNGFPIALTGNPGRPIKGDWALYALFQQLVWRKPGGEEARGITLFARVIGAPSAQNLIDVYVDGGVTFTGMIPYRPDDGLAIGLIYSGISDQVSGSDQDAGLSMARNFEFALEICYTAQLERGWALQPDFQYIVNPGGNVLNANGTEAENAAVFGVRTTLSF